MAMKQMEPTTVMIGGMSFYITPFPAFKAANISGELYGRRLDSERTNYIGGKRHCAEKLRGTYTG